MDNIFIVDRLLDDNLSLMLSPFYRDSVGTEDLDGNTG